MVFNMRFSYTHIITLIIFTPSPTKLSPTPADPYLPICPPPSSILFVFSLTQRVLLELFPEALKGSLQDREHFNTGYTTEKKCLSLSQQLLTAHKFHKEAESCELLPSPLLDVSGSTQPDPVSL